MKGQGRDPNMLRAQNLGNGWGLRLDYYGAPIGHEYLGIEWSRDR